MATSSFSTRVRHDSDAAFREWGLELSDALTAVGAPKTADTGQIDWSTVTRAGLNSEAGYEIRYLNDGLHGTTPIYFRLGFGTGGATDRLRIELQVGEGSNGSGSLTGLSTANLNVTTSSGVSYTDDTAYPSYISFAKGCLSVLWKIGKVATAYAPFGFHIARPFLNSGAIGSQGARLWVHNGSSTTSQPPRFTDYDKVNGAWSTLRSDYGPGIMIWTNQNTAQAANPSGDLEMSVAHIHVDRTRPCYIGGIGGVGTNQYQTFTTTPVGATSVTYLILPPALGACGGTNSGGVYTTSVNLCIPWE